MGKIINEKFEVGQQYKGQMNGAVLEVVKVQEPGVYHNEQWDYNYQIHRTLIHFRDTMTGKIHTCELDTAKRLLLTPLS